MKKAIGFLFVLAMISCSALAEQAIAYYGKLIPAEGVEINRKTPIQIEFRLYCNAEPGETMALWGRRMSVRLDENGSFYAELKDSSGTDTGRTMYKNLCDAVASRQGEDIYISLKPVGYSELLPRKMLFGVHRSEYAAVASAADRVEAPTVKSDSAAVARLNVGGNLIVTDSFVSTGGKVVDTFDGTDSAATIGMDGGKVVFSSRFSCWNNMTLFSRSTTHVCADSLFCWKYSDAYGAFVIPHPIDSNVHSLDNLVGTQQFLLGYFSAIW